MTETWGSIFGKQSYWFVFSEVEVNRPGYSPSRECGEVNILGFSPTLRLIITLAYTKPVNQ